MTTADQVKLDRLASLRQEPEAQRAYAMQLVQTERSLAVVGAALDLLLANPSADARPALLKRYAHLAAEGPRRDAGGLTRARIIDGLRQFGRQDDGDLFEKAACTYEHSLIDGQEIGQMVRSAGLIALGDLDPALADYHAARLLIDEHTSAESCEPAVTAVRVLASHGTLLPLYTLVMQHQMITPRALPPEVVAEALRSLSRLPVSLFPLLLAAHEKTQDDVLVLGLFDLLLARGVHAPVSDYVARFLRQTRSLDQYRYVVTTIVANWREDLLPVLAHVAQTEVDREKLSILNDAIATRAGHPLIDVLATGLRERLHRSRKRGRSHPP